MPDFAAVVVGGGAVGAAAALHLANLGRRVLLIERRRPSLRLGALGYDPRTVALNSASRTFLRRLGVWDKVPAQPVSRMRVWEALGTSAITFDAAALSRDGAPPDAAAAGSLSTDSLSTEALAWVVETGRLVEALWSCLDAMAGSLIEIIAPADVDDVIDADEVVSVCVDGRKISAEILIGADGATSKVRELTGAGLAHTDLRATAFATVAEFERPHRGVAYQRFGRSGPLALLPLAPAIAPAGDRDGSGGAAVSVIWSVAGPLADRLKALSGEGFSACLSQASEGVLGEVRALDAVAKFPLGQALVDSFNPESRVLIIGDAARTIHPLAGQGVNLGIEDVAAVGRVAQSAVGDLGAAGRWRSFARRRRTRAQFMITLMAGLDRAYGAKNPTLRWFRNVGVRWVDGSPLVKRQLMREAMGLGALARTL